MTDARWQRLKDLVGDALERPAAERAAFLDAACAGDAALRAEAEALVAAADDGGEDGGFVSPFDAWRSGDDEEGVDGAAWTGRRIGPYEVVGLLGRGGMGAVYEVARVDGHFEQRGALKLAHPAADGPALRRRFEQERQILASLDHPNIAHLFDGGVTDEGQPYLVMEFVEGEPLLAYCDAHRLGTVERVRLFLQVCEAVRFAHQHLVVHRDLKPSNILVTPEGRVKLLDFGIAKLLGEAVRGEGGLTRTAVGLFTPEYAAPEQVAGGPITTATDVYQLGAILYELLAGRRPFELAGLTPAAIERHLATAEPRRPSAAVLAPPTRPAGVPPGVPPGEAPSEAPAPTRALTPDVIAERRGTRADRLRRLLGGDLDNIILKALRKEPGARYPSVEALADDLRRYLDGRPVAARPATFAYRAAKFVRRYRGALAAAAAVLLVAAGLSMFYTLQVRAERDRAEEALAETQSALAFLQTMIWSAGPEDGDAATPIGVVLDSAAARIETELADRPGVASTIHAAVGYAYMSQGRYEAAERHTRRALALRTGAPDSNRVALLSNLAILRTDQGDFEGALPYHAASIALIRSLDPDSPLLASALNGHAATLIETGDFAQAEALLDEALPLYRRAAAPDDILPALNNLVIILQYQGRHEEAVPRMREVIERMRATVGPDHYQLGVAVANLAGSLSKLGRTDEATATYEEALGILGRTVEEGHPNLLLTRISLAEHLLDAGDLARAGAAVEPVLPAAEASFGAVHPITAYALNVAGQIDCRAGRGEAGVARLRESYALRGELYPDGHWLTASSGSLLGGCLAQLGRYDEAEPLLTETYATIRAALGDDHLSTVGARARVRDLYVATGRPERAAAFE